MVALLYFLCCLFLIIGRKKNVFNLIKWYIPAIVWFPKCRTYICKFILFLYIDLMTFCFSSFKYCILKYVHVAYFNIYLIINKKLQYFNIIYSYKIPFFQFEGKLDEWPLIDHGPIVNYFAFHAAL